MLSSKCATATLMAALYSLLGLSTLAGVTTANAEGLPPFSGNLDIARQMIDGDAHLLIVGDSIQYNRMISAYLNQWHPARFSGQVISPNLSTTFGQNLVGDTVVPWFTQSWMASTSPNQIPGQAAPADGYVDTSPGSTSHVSFAAAAVGPSANLTSNRFYSISINAGQEAIYAGGPWTLANDGKVNIDLLLYSNPEGLASGMQFDVRGSSLSVPLASTPLSTYSATPELTKVPVSFTYQPADPDVGFSGEFRMADGTTPVAGSNFIFAGARVYTGQPGMQIANIAQGSKGVDYFLSTDNVSDENLSRFIQLTDSNIAYIWIGANDRGLYDKDQWKAKMEDLLARYRTARPGMEFVLVANYELGGTREGEFAQDLYEIANESNDVLFLNLYGTAGNFDFLDQNYLSDHVHPSPAGASYFAGQVWSLVTQAAAPVPEPTCAALLGLGSLLLLRRRTRSPGQSE